MAPKRGMSVEKTEEHENFMKDLVEYHEKRGTTLDPEPKVGVRRIDLYKLYTRIVEEGGYDLVSDTKAKPLMWRKFAEEFIGKNQYTAAQAFQIKNVYYKNLCAYEISTHWKQEPPPKEILEDLTAKGANVMGRTLENFERPPTKEERDLQTGKEESEEGTSPDQKTPRKEEETEEPGSGTGRTTRGLRQAPPQRVLFQPDVHSGRQTRGALQQSSTGTPTPGASGSMYVGSAIHGASSTLASYEPSQSYPLSLKPVTTPSNNPDYYRQQLKRKAEAAAGPLARKYRNIMLPGTGFIGPNIYVRAQLALQSGIEAEEEYALHHLVKISHERGDKYRFDQFPGLAEALVRKAMRVCSMFYDVEWEVSYDEETMYADDEVLNGLSGTSDVVQRLRSRIPKIYDDGLLDAPSRAELNRIMEAALVVRNMSLQHENAKHLISMPLARDYLTVVLNLPQHESIIELQHYALDTAEQLLVYTDLGPRDLLYQALLHFVQDGQDRGAVVLALRTLARIGMHLPHPKRLDGVPSIVLKKVQAWLLVEDEELRSACLDFLFQFTTHGDSVDTLLQVLNAESLAQQLSRLLTSGAKEERTSSHREAAQEDDRTSQPVPKLSRSVVEQILKLDDPERSSEWLRMCFIADRDSEMTQISLWQAYQQTFASYGPAYPHMIAGDFIKQVSTTFSGATAQVAGSNRYVIRGIRARKTPVETGMLPGSKAADKGRELHRCRWHITVQVEPARDPLTGALSGPTTREVECGEWFKESDAMLRHTLTAHLQLPVKAVQAEDKVDKMDIDTPASAPGSRPASAMANGHSTPTAPRSIGEMFDFAAPDKMTYRCRWAGCAHISAKYPASKIPRTALFARHVQTHLPDTDAEHNKHNLRAFDPRHPVNGERITLQTLQDEKSDAAGVPLGAALVLRNIARFMPASLPADAAAAAKRAILNGGKEVREEGSLMERVFGDEVMERLMYAVTFARPVHRYVGDVLRMIGRAPV